MLPGINFWKITDFFLAGWALCGINYRYQSFSGFTPLAWQITGIGLKATNPSKKVLKITGPALFRISSVIISARTVCGFEFFPRIWGTWILFWGQKVSDKDWDGGGQNVRTERHWEGELTPWELGLLAPKWGFSLQSL